MIENKTLYLLIGNVQLTLINSEVHTLITINY